MTHPRNLDQVDLAVGLARIEAINERTTRLEVKHDALADEVHKVALGVESLRGMKRGALVVVSIISAGVAWVTALLAR